MILNELSVKLLITEMLSKSISIFEDNVFESQMSWPVHFR